jgi:hypothetical protein
MGFDMCFLSQNEWLSLTQRVGRLYY